MTRPVRVGTRLRPTPPSLCSPMERDYTDMPSRPCPTTTVAQTRVAASPPPPPSHKRESSPPPPPPPSPLHPKQQQPHPPPPSRVQKHVGHCPLCSPNER